MTSTSFSVSFPDDLLNDLDTMRGELGRSDFLQKLVKKEKKNQTINIMITDDMLKPQLM